MVTTPCAEICIELGEYFFNKGDYNEAAIWFQNAAYETPSIIYIRSSGDIPLKRLSDCYNQLSLNYAYDNPTLAKQYQNEANKLLTEAQNWVLPEML